ncbi:MAG: Hsp33 family molecular chaperone HslO [Candidatus Kapabacteria bacterium]|nr:Hsp33 family molecular chaperone HslO [Ignavibacteriota bacterium]MCW5885961.1 Hsp33 family molecular chaperone HslO [Candidatus Kapabacteria bacterium]
MNKEELKRNIQLRDRTVRVLSNDGFFRAVCVKNSTSAKTAQENHKLDSISATMLARALSGASLAAALLNGEERVSIEANGDGDISKVFAEAIQLGEVRGFVEFKDAGRSINFTGMDKLLGEGLLRVTRVLYNRSEPVQGIVPIQKGDISTDLAYFYSQSEQIPSAVILDSKPDSNGMIIQSGGLLVQAMPGFSEIELIKLFTHLSQLDPLTDYFEKDLNPLQVLKEVLPFEFEVLSSSAVDFFCRCSKDNFISKLMTLGKQEIIDMQKTGQNELVCKYCNKHYYLTEEDFMTLTTDLTAKNN